MLDLDYHSQFKRDMKLIQARKLNINLLREVVSTLRNENKLPERCRDHAFSGSWKGCRDCHIQGDWILIYKIIRETNTLLLVRTGSHSDLGLS